MRFALLTLLVACLVLTTGCGRHHRETTQLHFDQSMRYVNGIETPVVVDFPAPDHHSIDLELIDGTRITGTAHIYEPSEIAKYSSVPVSLDFQTLADLKSHRGTARLVIFEPGEYGETPYSTHLEKGQSPEGLAREHGKVLAILDLRRVN